MLKLLIFEPNKESREESEVAGFLVFSHIRMMVYFRLGYIRVNECQTGLEHWPRRVRASPKGLEIGENLL